jgi:hypothetical protein
VDGEETATGADGVADGGAEPEHAGVEPGADFGAGAGGWKGVVGFPEKPAPTLSGRGVGVLRGSGVKVFPIIAIFSNRSRGPDPGENLAGRPVFNRALRRRRSLAVIGTGAPGG